MNPEGAGFCALCGVPFLAPARAQAPVARPPSRVKGESRQIDARGLQRHLDDDSTTRTHEELVKQLEALAPGGATEPTDELDRLLSDYDGAPRQPAAPQAPPSRPAASATQPGSRAEPAPADSASPAPPPAADAPGTAPPKPGPRRPTGGTSSSAT
jgi:hypothetical protein